MSVESLKRSIRADDYRHHGEMPNNFSQTLSPSQQALRAIATFKDEYLLDFINVEQLGERDALDVDERVLEQGVVLCKDVNKAFVDYVVRDYAKPMGVATYKTSKDMSEELLRALPPIKDLEAILEGGEG